MIMFRVGYYKYSINMVYSLSLLMSNYDSLSINVIDDDYCLFQDVIVYNQLNNIESLHIINEFVNFIDDLRKEKTCHFNTFGVSYNSENSVLSFTCLNKYNVQFHLSDLERIQFMNEFLHILDQIDRANVQEFNDDMLIYV